MQKPKIRPVLAMPIVLGAMALTVSPVAAAVSNDNSSPAYVIVSESVGIARANGDTFYPTGPIGEDTLVVISEPDGTLPNGLTIDKLQAFAEMPASERAVAAQSLLDTGETMQTDQQDAMAPSATTYAYAAASSTAWSRTYTGGSVIGTSDKAKVQYNFWAANFTSQRNVAQGRGYYRGYNGSQFGVWAKWYALGSATSAGGGGSVPWGNVASKKAIMAKCATTTVCGGGFN